MSHGPEAFVQAFARAEPALRAFVYSLLPTPRDVDDVMQEVSLVLWKKFDQYDPDTPFLKWAYVVARYQALSHRRKMARDRHVFSEDFLELVADEHIERTDSLAEERAALQTCLAKLPDPKRRLLFSFYRGADAATELAERLSCKRRTLYKRISRIRQQLRICVRTQVTP